MAFSITTAAAGADLDHVRELFTEYQRWLGFDLCFQGFAEELAALPGKYAGPSGRLLLARERASVAGGVGVRGLDSKSCEMKRLFVRSPWQGRGLGRLLAGAAVEAGRELGYEAMRLDTLVRLEAAVTLYRSMGFVEIAPYYANPLADVIYMELELGG